MDVTFRIDKEILYIAIEGRIDASNAAVAEEKIFKSMLTAVFLVAGIFFIKNITGIL